MPSFIRNFLNSTSFGTVDIGIEFFTAKSKTNASVFDTRSLTVTIGFATGNFAAEQGLEPWTFSGVPYGKLLDGRDYLSDGLAAIGSNHGSMAF